MNALLIYLSLFSKDRDRLVESYLVLRITLIMMTQPENTDALLRKSRHASRLRVYLSDLPLPHQPFDDVTSSVSDGLQESLARPALLAVVVEPPDMSHPIPSHPAVQREPTSVSVSFQRSTYQHRKTRAGCIRQVPGIMRVKLVVARVE